MELISLIQQVATDSLLQATPDSLVQATPDSLLQAAPDSAAADSTGIGVFLEKNSSEILVGVIVALVTLMLTEPIKWLYRKISEWVNKKLEAFGRGFEKNYLAAMARDHQRLKLIGFTDRVHPPLLKDVYVSLRMSAAYDQEPEDEDEKRKFGLQESRRFGWQQMFSLGKKQIVVLGQPGSGKSTLMDYLALIFSRQVPNALPEKLDNPVPVFVRLRDIGKDDKTLLDLLYKPDCLTNINTPKRFFEQRLEQGKCLVLLDGLDEVLDEQAHGRVVRAIQQLINQFPDNWYVVTCRVAGWKNQLPNFHPLEVQPFDTNDILQFISAWYREVVRVRALSTLGPEVQEEEKEQTLRRAATNAQIEADNLFDALKKKQGLLRIAQTPLILSLITLVYYADQARLPNGRAKLYERCLAILLDQWDWEDKKLATIGAPNLNEKLAAMKTIALHYLKNDLLDMDESGLQALVDPLLPDMQTELGAESFIDHIVSRSGILQEKSIGQYGFAHRALQDYLAAAAIADGQSDTLLLEHVDDEEAWWEVILIAIAIVPSKRAETLVKALFEYSQTNLNSLIVAGLSLAEDVIVGASIREGVVAKLTEELGRTENLSMFQRLFDAFRAADNEGAEKWIEQILVTEDETRLDHVLALISEQMVSDQSSGMLPLLVNLVQQKEKPSLQTRALMAISKTGIEPDASLWTLISEARQSDSYAVRRAATWAYCELGRYEELGMVKVPAGAFTMGGDSWDEDSLPEHEVFLPTYYVSKTPVTVEQYKVFTKATNHITVGDFGKYNTKPDHPVTAVRQTDGVAYAKHYGLALPSEAEWEKAARGTDKRVYPWGDEWDNSRCNSYYYWQGKRRLLFRKKKGTTTAVGMFSPMGDSPYGCTDMAGNVWEWTRSIYKSYPYDIADGREDETSEERRVVRGGSFDFFNYDVRCAYRSRLSPSSDDFDGGFRVVALPPSE